VKWAHLRNLKFPKLGSRPTIDILIGLDCADLHFSVKDIRGVPGQPVARLTSLGWTCIGAIDGNSQATINTNFAYTFFSVGQTDAEKVNLMLQKVLGS